MMEADTSTFTEVDLKQEKIEEVITSEAEEKFHCDLCDHEMVHKLAVILLEGLSTACVDSTTGDIFRSPGSVAAELRKEMLEYLTNRTEFFVAESLLIEGNPEDEIPDEPSGIISDFIEDFAALKRNLLSRLSGVLLSELRDERIDDFVQDMELNSFWVLDRRETFAQKLLKNVDFKNEYHCKMKFKSEAELEKHRQQCGFRTLLCDNEGCNATFSAAKEEKHDSVCPFKLLPCEQQCGQTLLRNEMDKHCITVCTMKPVNCPFFSIGCKATMPSCNVKQHIVDDIRFHLLFALMYLHKGALAEDLRSRVEQIEQESISLLVGIQSVRNFTNTVKDLDSKLGPFKVIKKPGLTAEVAQNSDSEKLASQDISTTVFEESKDGNSKKPESKEPAVELQKSDSPESMEKQAERP